MSALGQLLERLRRVSAPPGAAARVLAVPAAGDRLAHEVAFLFGELDGVQRDGRALVAAARRDAAAVADDAAAQRRRMLADAQDRAARMAEAEVAQRRAAGARRAAEIRAAAEREAALVRERGAARTPALMAVIVERVLGPAP